MRSRKPLSSRVRSILHRAAGMELLEGRLYFASSTSHGRPLGVDVSTYQGSINWTTLAAQKEFAIIKGTGSDNPSGSNFSNYLDSTFTTNAKAARTAGIIFGTYHFAEPDSTTSATAQADYMIAHSGIAMENGNLPPMLDLERGTSDPTTISNWVNAFCYEIYARLGVKPIIYTSSGTYAEDVNASVYNTWKFVDANYGTTNGVYTDSSAAVDTGGPATGHWPTWTIWQYSSVASVPGIGTDPVDSDVFNGTLAQLQAMEVSNQAIVQVGAATKVGDALPYLASTGGTDNSGTAIAENYGSVAQGGTSPSMTFTIENEGSTTLTLGSLAVPNGYAIVDGLSGTSLAVGGFDTITVKMNTGTGGTFAGNITFTTNDPDTPTFKIPVTGTVTGVPQIAVKNGSTTITNGQSTAVSFGSVQGGSTSPSITYTVSDPGGGTLTTSGLTVPSGYTITNTLAASIAVGGSDTFTIALSTANIGTFTGNVSFTNNVSGQSPFTFPITGTVTDPTPAAPSNLQFTSYTTNSVTMTWSDNSNNETAFFVERKTGASGIYSQIGSTNASVATFTDSASTDPSNVPTPGATYFYRVRAVNGSHFSNYATEQSITTLANTPTNVAATDGTLTDRVTITWSAPTGAAQYQVYRASTSNGTPIALGVPTSATTEDDMTATPGTTYYYWVAALNSAAVASPMAGPDGGFIPPAISSGSFVDASEPTTVSLTFNEPMQTMSAANLSVTNTDGNAAPTITGFNYSAATNTATFDLSAGLVDGHYQAILTGAQDLSGHSLVGANSLDFSFLTADADGDGTVDSGDFAVIAANYGMTGSPTFNQGDFNYDGTVNALDFNALASRFGQTELPAGSSLAVASAPVEGSTVAESLPASSASPAASLFSNQPVTQSVIDLADNSDSSILS